MVRKRRKSNKTIVILLFVAGIFISLAIASYFNQPHGPQSLRKKPAEEYFKVLNAKVLGCEPRGENVWKIYLISFELQAIGGDAHNVVIQSWAMSEPQ